VARAGPPAKVALSNVQKVLWPHDGYTKGDLIEYYQSVARWLLPYVRDRPLSLERFPNGIDAQSFFEKNAPRGAPDWIQTYAVASNGKSTNYILCNDIQTLTYLANLACVTLHVWLSRVSALDNPDFILFDMDPWKGCSLGTLARVSVATRDLLVGLGLTPLVKTSGGSGLHVIVPLRPVYDYQTIKQFTELVARHMLGQMPKSITLERMTARRPAGTVYIDYVQIGRGKTLVPPYVVRARQGAPVSVPLSWAQVEAMRSKRSADTTAAFASWTVGNVSQMLKSTGDPWANGEWKEQRIETAVKEARPLLSAGNQSPV